MLIEDTFRDELAGFPRHVKVTAVDLRVLASRIDWRSDHAPAIAREHLTQRLDEALAAAEALAAEKAIPLDRLWRNLIATASEADEGVYRLLLDHAARLGQKPLGDAQGQIRETLAPIDPTTAAIIDFLNAAGPPSPDLLGEIAPAQRVARFLSFARAEVQGMGSGSHRLADRLLRGASGIFGANRPDRAVSHTAAFLASEGLDARLSPTQLARLEHGLRSALLNANDLWAKLLSRSALKEAKAQTRKARSLGAAETVPSLREALETIAAGHLADARVLPALALWPLKARELRLLEQAIQRIPSAPPDLRNPRLVRWLQREPPQPALRALSLLARPKERWVATMAAWDEAELKSAVRLVGPDRVVAVLFEVDTPLSLWRRFVAVPGHTAIVLGASGLRLYELMAASTQDATFDQALPKLLQLIMLCDPSGEHVQRGDGLGIRLPQIFRQASPRRLRRFLDLAELRRLRAKQPSINALAGAALLHFRGRCLATRSDQPDDKQQRRCSQYLRALKGKLDLLSGLPDTELLPEELDLILNAPQRCARAGTLTRSLLATESEAHRRGLDAYAAYRAAAGNGLPKRLWRALRRKPARLDEVLLAHPNLLDATAVSLLPMERLVTLAFRSRDLARRLEGAVPRASLLATMAFVQVRPKRAARVRAARELALVLGLDLYPFLLKLAWQLPTRGAGEPGHAFAHLYRTYELPKKSGGKRTITVPQDRLKALQRRILDQALEPLSVSAHATGFCRGKSIVDNAEAHTGAAVVVNVDIRQCFPNTGFRLIQSVAAKVARGELSALATWFLAELLSFQGALPTGAPSSPAVLNVALASADRAIGKACERRGITYTRYADDLTFSGDGKVTAILPFVIDVLRGYGFELDEKKTNIFRRGRRQVVTGLVVNEKPNLVRTLRRRLRAAVHHRVNGRTPFWHGKAVSDGELLGRLAFLGQTQPAEAARLRQALGAVLSQRCAP